MTGADGNLKSNDTGADTFERFHYQSSVAIPFCIDVAGGKLAAVYAEHEEDLAVECLDGSWRFIQIKTRDAHLGPWKLSDLVGRSGALRSLHRTHTKIANTAIYTLEVFLEGGLRKNNPIEEFVASATPSQATIAEVASKLKLQPQEASDFLRHVRVVGGLPSRDTIESKNTELLGRGAPATPHGAIARTNDRVAAAVLAAMRAPSAGLVYPTSVVTIATSSGQRRARLEAKRLDKARVEPLLAELQAPAFPLLASAPGESPYGSKLALKLRLAGATEAIVLSAQELRASASSREYELLSIESNSEVLTDVRTRLKAETAGLIARYSAAAKPAVEIWDELLGRLTARAATCDPRGTFHQDPYLLMGEIAQLTDMCEIEWRVTE